jgi:predicted DNA-binding transcriptional regulator AlpA
MFPSGKSRLETLKMPVALENLLSENEISQLFGRSIPTLQKDRLRGNGPPFIKIGRLVRYSPSAVQAWLDDQVRRSTSDPGEAA